MDPFQPFQNILHKVFVGMEDETEPVEKSQPAPVKTSSKKSRKTKKEWFFNFLLFLFFLHFNEQQYMIFIWGMFYF